jgi:hypothetical protein
MLEVAARDCCSQADAYEDREKDLDRQVLVQESELLP